MGLHPDEATDSIVDMSLKYRKPFAVVPCCVFPTKFSFRKLENGEEVRLREQLCQYLVEKGKSHNIEVKSEIVKEMPGPCNQVIYWQGDI